ncbi:MAG: transketolase [Candidatus Aenigmatarchaeota archaeon]
MDNVAGFLERCKTNNFAGYKTSDPLELEYISTFVRERIVDMLYKSKSGHPGGSLSCADILTTLYFGLDDDKGSFIDYNNSRSFLKPNKLVMSKGHGAPAQYAILDMIGHLKLGELDTLRKIDSRLQGHPSLITPGIEAPTGSLGQGLSIAVGLARGLKLRHDKNELLNAPIVYTILGDGEIQEGQVWEAVRIAADWGLGNLVVVVDNNGLQIDGSVEEISNIYPIADKFKAFNWDVVLEEESCGNGHNYRSLRSYFSEIRYQDELTPKVLVFDTIKAKGIPSLEGKVESHGVAPDQKQYEEALAYLSKRRQELEELMRS